MFWVKSMYLDLINSGTIPRSMHIWKVKMLLKIKVFMWFVHKQVILTKDNLAKRNWTGSRRCSFCDRDESIKHLFLDCPMTKKLWWSVHIAFNHSSDYHPHVIWDVARWSRVRNGETYPCRSMCFIMGSMELQERFGF